MRVQILLTLKTLPKKF